MLLVPHWKKHAFGRVQALKRQGIMKTMFLTQEALSQTETGEEKGLEGPAERRCQRTACPGTRVPPHLCFCSGPQGEAFGLLPLRAGYLSVSFQVVTPHHFAACLGRQALTARRPETWLFSGAFPRS